MNTETIFIGITKSKKFCLSPKLKGPFYAFFLGYYGGEDTPYNSNYQFSLL